MSEQITSAKPVSYTPRGFAVWAQVTDLYGSTVRVQSSSLATEPAVWIFAEQEGDPHPPHLSVGDATVVRDALTAWLAEVTP